MDTADGSAVLKVLEQVQLPGEKFAQLQDVHAASGRRGLDCYRSPASPPDATTAADAVPGAGG